MKAHLRYLSLAIALLCGSTALHAQLSGTITIPNTTYPTLASVVTALNTQGVGTSGCTINFTAATNEVAPSGGYKLGSSTLNASLTASSPLVINGNGNVLSAYTGTSTTADAIFTLQGTDYVTINGLHLAELATNTSTTTRMEWGYVLCKLQSSAPYDGCQHNTIKNCNITLNGTYNNTVGIYAKHTLAGTTSTLSTASITAASGNNYNKFTGNTISGVTRGIYLYGISTLAGYDKANEIGGTTPGSGNTITVGGASNTCYAINTMYDSVIYVRYNTMNIAPTQGNVAVYFYLPSTGVGDLTFTNNYMNISSSLMTSAYVYCYYNNQTHKDPGSAISQLLSTHTISDNEITGNLSAATSSHVYPIYEYFAYSKNLDIERNNIHDIGMNNSTGYFWGIYAYYTYSPFMKLNDNIIRNFYKNGTSGYFYGIYTYNYPQQYGIMEVNDNQIRNVFNRYYTYTYYVYGSGTKAPTGYTDAQLHSYRNIADSIDLSAASSGYIYNYMGFYGNDSSVIAYDTLTNMFLPTTGSGGMYNYFGYGYYGPKQYISKGHYMNNATGGTGTNYIYNYLGYYTTLFDSSTFENFTLNGGGYIYNYLGFYTPGKVTNNRFQNWTCNGSSGIYWYMGYYGEPTLSYNLFKNMSINGSGSYYSYGPGYYPNNMEFDHNRWDSIYVNSGQFQPTYSYNNGGKFSIHDNVMSRMYTNSTSRNINYYYMLGNGGSYDFYNNTLSDIDFPSGYNSTNSIGVNMASSIPYNVYNNTIRVKPSNPSLFGANFGFTGMAYSSGASLDYRNNLVNIDASPGSSGYVVALRRTSGTSGTPPANFLGSSNGNIYYTPNVTSSWLYGEGSSAGSMVNTYDLTSDPNFNTPCGLFKSFMGHDKSSFTENNLVASPYPGAYWPTGTSYAEKGSVPTTAPQVVKDLANVTRPALYDIGALEFSGTAKDDAPPVISYTPIPTRSYCVTQPTLVATITDVTGVDTSTGNKPRLYFKKSGDANTYAGNTSSDNGWKWVEPTSISGSTYVFDFKYSILRSAVSPGDSITYFVVAQDITTNKNTSGTTAAFTACPGTVVLAASNFPVLNAPTPNGFKILNTPTFLATAFPAAVCQSGSAVVSVSPIPVGATMQWESANIGGSFSPIPGATGTSVATGFLTSSKVYRAVIYCGSSVLTMSPNDTFIVAKPALLGVTNDTLCGYGVANLSVTPGAFSTAKWYKTATGGKSFYSGNSYTTPKIGANTTYYVSAITPNASTGVAGKTPPAAYSYTMYNYGHEIVFHNATTNFYSTTVYPQGSGTVTLELIDINTGSPAKDIFGNNIPQRTFTVSGSGGVSSPNVLNLNWSNIAPGDYSFNVVTGGYTSGMYFNYEYHYPSHNYPFTTPSGNVEIVGPTYNSAPYPYLYYYWFFYNNVFSDDCESPTRVPVTAYVNPAPPITLSNPSAPGVCAGKSATLSVSSPNVYYAYSWNPGSATTSSITVTPTSGCTMYYLTAIDPYTGCVAYDSTSICATPVPAPPTISPSPDTICSGSSTMLTGKPDNGKDILAIVGTGTLSTGSYGQPTPFPASYSTSASQYLIRPAEMIASGMAPGPISAIYFYSDIKYNNSSGSQTYLDSFEIRMANVTNTSLTSTMIDLYTVSSGAYSAALYKTNKFTPPTTTAGLGWVKFVFSTPFVWDGVSSVLVDVHHQNCTNCPGYCYDYNYNGNGSVRYSNTGFTSTTYYTNYGGPCGATQCKPPYAYTRNSRPNMAFDAKGYWDMNWLNVSALWKNSGLTSAMSLADTNKVVYAAPTVTTIYTGVTNANGCKSLPSLPDTVYVNPAPDVTITPAGSNTICSGSSVTLCIPTAANQTYQWYRNGSMITGGTSNCYTVNTAGTYKVTATNILTGCTATSINSVVVVNPSPTVSVSAGSTTTFCNGGSVTLTATATGAAMYQWAKNGVNIAGATGTTYVATSTGNYTCTVTATNSCTATSGATTVTVNTVNTTVTPQGSLTFCTGGSVTLQGPTGTGLSYVWYQGSTSISGATSSSYTATTAGTYYVRVTDATTGCSDTSVHYTVIVGAAPSAAITPSPTASFCAGGSVVLSTNPAPGLTYQWKVGGVNVASGGNGSTYTASAAGSYTVLVSIAATPACNATTATPTVVSVNPLPAPTISAGGATTFCGGDSVVLTAGAITGVSYQWNLNGTPIPTNGTSSSYVARTSGSYTMTATNTTTGCQGTSNAVVVTANTIPTITLAPNGPITFCQGGSVTLSTSLGAGYTLVWNKNGSPIVPAVTSTSYVITTTGLYTVTATNTTTGCKATSAVTSVQVNALPDPSTLPTGNTPICQNTTVTIGAVTVDTNMTYQWKVNGVAISGATSSSFTTGSAGTYTLVVTNKVTGCQASSANIVITIVTPPTAIIAPPAKTTICAGDSVQLSANTGTGLTYKWRLNGNVISGATNSTYYALLPGNYTVAVSSGSQCEAISNSIGITVNPRPAAYITYNSPLEFCEGSAVVLVANAGTGLTYQWLRDGVLIGNTGSFNVSATTGAYTLKVTNSLGCVNESDSVNVLVYATPSPVIVNPSGSTLQTTVPFVSYQWFFNNVAIGGATNSTYNFTQNGAYKVRVVDANGCEGYSEQFFANNVGVANTAVGNAIRVYPNPTTGLLNIESKVAVSVALRDVTGKTIISARDVKKIDMGDVANGIYLLYISDLDGHLLRVEKVTKSNR
ncbi:MAG: hypothetical protein JST36_06745 [Bacteroidetes bacterium]|nr:hypothetical protein [Bacteroidota bacterium]